MQMKEKSKQKGLGRSKSSIVSSRDVFQHERRRRKDTSFSMEGGGSNPSPRAISFWRRFRPYFEWNQKMGLKECPYFQRWVFGFGLFSIRIHKWNGSDDARNFHDHPWSFITYVLSGGYTDISPAGEDYVGEGEFRYRPALWRHTVKVDPGGCWTLLLTGPEIRYWGFWVNGKKFKKANKYFLEHGHHPCEN